MTNIKAKGFANPAQLREHLDELDDETQVVDRDLDDPVDDVALQKEVAWLRKEVADLHERALSMSGDPQHEMPRPAADRQYLVRIAMTAATTWVVGKVIRRFGLGILGSALAPVIATQLNKSRS